jgi:glycosyltransferase involved in cell wall biosynthesis
MIYRTLYIFVQMVAVLLVFNLDAQPKKLVVIIPSYNNALWFRQNLASVFCQDYSNFRIIYIDDCSTDDTYTAVKTYVAEQNKDHIVTLIRQEARKGAMANWYYAISLCADEDIIINLDGDDWLAHAGVLSRIAQEYKDPHTWMTYGSFVSYPSGEIGFAQELEQYVINGALYREKKFVTTHLRTFYAWLFKKIKKEDFLYKENEFFPMVCDQAMMFPMLEMAGDHAHFIKNILYVYNRANPINDEKVSRALSAQCEHIIRSKTHYKRLLL